MALALEYYRGNNKPDYTVTVTSGGVAFDLTGYKLKFTAKEEWTDPDTATKINKEITVSAPATGVGVLSLTHAETDISPAEYVCEIKLYKADGSFVQTLDTGTFTLKDVALLTT